MPAIICEVKEDILGMDFINKFKLSMVWDDFDQTELLLVDKKAQIQQELQVVTVPTNLPRVHYLDSSLPNNSSLPPSSLELSPQRSVDSQS